MKWLVVMAAAFISVLSLGPRQASAAPDVTLNWGSQANPGQCDVQGPLAINVTHQVVNDLDDGVKGNFWAVDDYNKHIQVWKISTNPDTYCVDVRYLGSFTTLAGYSPGGTNPNLPAGIEGTYEGGYRAIIVGTLRSPAAYRTRGNLGTFDYNYRKTPFDWVGTFFQDGYDFTYEFWGWIYHGGNDGVWVNASTGNQGDITN